MYEGIAPEDILRMEQETLADEQQDKLAYDPNWKESPDLPGEVHSGEEYLTQVWRNNGRLYLVHDWTGQMFDIIDMDEEIGWVSIKLFHDDDIEGFKAGVHEFNLPDKTFAWFDQDGQYIPNRIEQNSYDEDDDIPF